jgi:hypothetical protein
MFLQRGTRCQGAALGGGKQWLGAKLRDAAHVHPGPSVAPQAQHEQTASRTCGVPLPASRPGHRAANQVWALELDTTFIPMARALGDHDGADFRVKAAMDYVAQGRAHLQISRVED